MKTIELKVSMPCGGCSSAIERALQIVEGVQSVKTDLAQQIVTIQGLPSLDKDTIVKTLRQTQREPTFVREY